MMQDNTTQVTQADVDYVAGLCADRKGAWQSKVMRALIAIGRRTEAASRAREDALAAEVERLRALLSASVSMIEALLIPLERAAAEMVAHGKTPDEAAERVFDTARTVIVEARAALTPTATDGEVSCG